MVCIYCGGDTSVVNSRPQKRLNKVWRRRNCQSCKALFTSIESPAFTDSLVVDGRNGLEAFQRDKLFLSVYESCKHRESAVSDASALCDTILGKIPAVAQNATLKRSKLIKLVGTVLGRFDNVAAVHYTAYHKP